MSSTRFIDTAMQFVGWAHVPNITLMNNSKMAKQIPACWAHVPNLHKLGGGWGIV